mmetsp:Transcript_87431/g.131147  ORF Transcript_87431/g.131147 Transcript_87431/m.131147 type:complete len:119 (-) Transcript_87431:406-762(-)
MFRLAVLFLVVAVSASFDADRCKLIDQTNLGALPLNTTNYLFRGSLPLDDNGNFEWDTMNTTFHEIVPSMANDYILIDLSLLNDFEPIEDYHESSYFRRHPKKRKVCEMANLGQFNDA